MSSNYSLTLSRMTFWDNPYIPPPNSSTQNAAKTRVSSKHSEQLYYQRNSSGANLNKRSSGVFDIFDMMLLVGK